MYKAEPDGCQHRLTIPAETKVLPREDASAVEFSSHTCRPLVSKELPIETKAFYFEIGENTRGRFLRVSESGAG